MAGLMPEFQQRNCKILGLSVDPVANHARWAKDIEETQGHAVTYPMIGDPELKIAKLYDMLPEGAGDTSRGPHRVDNATVRSVFLIGPDKKIKAMLTYPMSSGRNFDEVLRLLELGAADRETRRRHPGQLEAGRQCNHPSVSVGRTSAREISRQESEGFLNPTSADSTVVLAYYLGQSLGVGDAGWLG